MSGILPNGFEDLTLWPSLQYISISNNKLQGRFSSSFVSIKSNISLIDFSKNQFIGGLPVKVDKRHLSYLQVFVISYNQLEGPIPIWIGDLESL